MSLTLLLKTPPVIGGANTAVFQFSDTSTQGSWNGVYGADGYAISNLTSTIGSGVTWSELSNVSEYVWNGSTTDTRALYKGTEPNRIASTYYTTSNASPEVFDINITDGNQYQFALYNLDFDGAGGNVRRQSVSILDGSTSSVLDTQAITTSMFNGIWLVWNITGHVKVSVTCTAGDVGVVSAFMFKSLGPYSGGGGTPPPTDKSGGFFHVF